jgi:hypothetical protein
MTKTLDFYGAAKAAPLQNGDLQTFSAACEAVPFHLRCKAKSPHAAGFSALHN